MVQSYLEHTLIIYSKYKNEGFKVVKNYLNVLHGALCQTDVISIKSNIDSITEIHEDKEICIMHAIGDLNSTTLHIEVYKPAKRCEYDYARIKPFLVAKGRYMISKIIAKNIDEVVRVHTDGIICKSEITNIQLGNNIGDLKFEAYTDNCIVENSQRYRGFEKTTTDIFELLKTQQELANKLYPLKTT